MKHVLILSALFVSATAFANVMQKKAVIAVGPVNGAFFDFFRRLVLSPQMWAAIAAYALSLAMYWLLLARVPLNVATSIAALNFIVVLVASRVFLGESIPPLRYLGFGCILLGIFIISLTQRSTS